MALPRSRGAFMNRWGAIFSKRGGIRYRKEVALVWFEGRVYKTVGARRSSGALALQVRDSMIAGWRGTTTGSRGAFMNRWAPRRESYAVLSKRDGIRYWQEWCQPGLYAAFTNL